MSQDTSNSVPRYDAEHCIICSDSFVDNPDKEKCCVKAKGINNLVKFCILRGHSELKSYLETDPPQVIVHKRCRSDYIQYRGFTDCDEDSEKMNPPKKTMSQSSTFHWKNDCFLCGYRAVIDDRHPNQSDKVHLVTSLPLRDKILEVCAERQDLWAV